MLARIPELDFRVWPDTGPTGEIDVALVWKPPPGLLADLPKLRLIQSLGMGIDHIAGDPTLPRDVPLSRLVDPDMAGQMSEYALLAVLWQHRMMDDYLAQQAAGDWRHLGITDTARATVGIMGLGVLGSDAARKLRALGFRVRGWSASPKSFDGIDCFHGPDGLMPFLADCNHLICLLPLTPQTTGIIDARLLAALPRGAHVVNMARGGHLVEDDLLAALASGHIAAATLDVFAEEPLPADHPFRRHPRISATPHMAALTNPRTAVEQVAANILRLRAGDDLLHLVDLDKGY